MSVRIRPEAPFLEGKPTGELATLGKRMVRASGYGSGPLPSAILGDIMYSLDELEEIRKLLFNFAVKETGLPVHLLPTSVMQMIESHIQTHIMNRTPFVDLVSYLESTLNG